MGIAAHIKELAGKREPHAHVAKVVSVDASARTCVCDPIGDYAEVKSRVQASIEQADGVSILPKVGSYVVVVLLGDEHAYVSLHSQVDEIEWKIANQTLSFTSDGLELKSASGNLAKQLVELIDELAKVMGDLAAAQVITPVGPGTLSADVITKLQASKLKLSNTIKPTLKSYLNGA